MKTAILSVTVQGAKLGQKIRSILLNDIASPSEIVCYEKEGRPSGQEAIYYEKMGELMSEIFPEVDRILCIMSTGVVVRVIAPFLVHKSKDPAIVVMDEKANHVISLLSGHLGGANAWALALGQYTGADPVITTASDVNGLPAPDELARTLHCKIDNFHDLVQMNSALVNGEKIAYYIDAELDHAVEYFEKTVAHGVEVHIVQLMENQWNIDGFLYDQWPKESHAVIISDKLWNIEGPVLFLRPPTMVVGVGCRRDTSKAMIYEAIAKSCKEQSRSLLSVFYGASVIVKSDEIGLLDCMEALHIPIAFFTQEDMQDIVEEESLEESSFVKEKIGVGNVCETVAILQGKSKRFIQKKTVYPQTTVAIVKANWSLSELDQVMPTR